jgi:hypothetical protein
MYKDYEIKLNAILDKHGVQKVELGLIDELKSDFKGLEKETKETLKYYNKALEAKAKFKKEITNRRNSLVSYDTRIKDDIKRIKKEAKTLGINTNDILEIKQAEKAIAETNTLIKSLNKY